jgi:hypothetical protein
LRQLKAESKTNKKPPDGGFLFDKLVKTLKVEKEVEEMLKITMGLILFVAGLVMISYAIFVFPPYLFSLVFGLIGLVVAVLGAVLVFKPSLILVSPEN